MDGEMDGWRRGEKAQSRGISCPPVFPLPASCARVPTRLFTHSLAWWRREENRHKSPKPNIRERGKGDRIRVGGADAAARYDDRRRSNEEAERGDGRDGKSNA